MNDSFLGCCHKVPQIGWPKTEIYSLTFLEKSDIKVPAGLFSLTEALE